MIGTNPMMRDHYRSKFHHDNQDAEMKKKVDARLNDMNSVESLVVTGKLSVSIIIVIVRNECFLVQFASANNFKRCSWGCLVTIIPSYPNYVTK